MALARTVERPSSSGSYRQYCAVARGLDLVGERWTLLIVRDLLTGRKRYTDLLAGLPGIGTNLLATRLRELAAQGLVSRRVLPPPAGSTVYELTEVGQALEPVVTALGRWGYRFLGARRAWEFLSANAYILAMRAAFRAEGATNLRETYELRVGNQVFAARVADGRCATSEERGATYGPDVVLTIDVNTLDALLQGELSPEEALTSGRAMVQGDAAALQRFVQLFALPHLCRGDGMFEYGLEDRIVELLEHRRLPGDPVAGWLQRIGDLLQRGVGHRLDKVQEERAMGPS